MIRTYTAYTQEVDDAAQAVAEIMAQLDLDGKNTLLKSSIGIVSCYAEYVDSGVWQALCEALPFEVVGTTTIANTIGEVGETMLTIMVITSDELTFATASSTPIEGEDCAQLEAMYHDAAGKLPGKPSMMLSFAPLLTNFGSDFYVDCISNVSGNVPNFGTLAVDHNQDYHESYVLLNGEHWRDCFAIVLIEGPIKPRFFIGTISEESMFQDKGVVTAAVGNQLQTVNGKSVLEYLQSLGLTRNEDGSITGINAFPIIVDYNDGTEPVIRAMFALTPDGHAVCGGNIPVGSTLSIGRFDSEEINATTRRAIETARGEENVNGMLMYSCIGRYFSQGFDSTAEFRALQELLGETGVPYMAAYSGGELCPVYGKEGDTYNRNHNNTFIICAF